MKAEELLNSMDYIGEDLLAEAEQTVLVKTRRPWLKTAVAAVLVAAIGVGGWLFLKNVNMKPSTPATDPSISNPIPSDTQTDTTDLPILEVGDTWEYLPSRYFSVSSDAPNLYDPSITQLPVYRDNVSIKRYQGFSVYEEAPVLYSEEQLQTILTEAAHRIGAAIPGAADYNRYDGICVSANVPTDKGTLWVHADGLVQLSSNDTSSFAQADSNEDLLVNIKTVNANIAWACKRLHLQQNQWSAVSNKSDFIYIFPARDDPKEQLLAFTFGSVRITVPTHGEHAYATLSWYQRPGSVDWNDMDQDWRELAGNYPLITLEEAKEQVAAGHYYSRCYDEPYFGSLTPEQLNNVELVYPLQSEHVTMMPFYRFFPSDDSPNYVCVPAVRPEYLSDWPEKEADPESSESETTEPVSTEPVSSETETTEPIALDPEALEQTLTEWESGLNDEYFSQHNVYPDPNNHSIYRRFFSDGHTRIWQDADEILKKDLATGKIETIFTLEHNEEITTALEGVTKNRLYFGWNEVEDWWGVDVYSVDYHNENRIDWARGQNVYFSDGWLRMDGYRTDVGPVSLIVIDRNDQRICALDGCWGDVVVDGSLYYVQSRQLYEQWLASLSDAEREALSYAELEEAMRHEQYDVCRIDPDGSITTIGTVAGSTYAEFYIDADRHELVYYGPYFGEAAPEEIPHYYCTYRYDLDTLTLKSGPKLFCELPMDRLDTSREVGVGINILRNDAEYVIFYNYFGLFGFDGTTGAPLFYLDFDEVLDRQGFTQIQGGGGTSCRFIEAPRDRWVIDNSIMIVFEDGDRNFTQCIILDLDLKYCYDPVHHYEEPDEYWERVSSYCNTEFVTSPYGGRTMAELWIEHNGEKWYPFRAE